MKTYPRTRRDLPRKHWSLRKKIVVSVVAAVVAAVVALGVIWANWKHPEIVVGVTRLYLAWSTEHSRLDTGLFIAAAIIAAALALWKLPKWQAARSQGISSKNRFEREDDARKTLAQVIGGIFLLAGLYSSIQTFNLQQEGQITDRYTKAIDQLGALLPGDKMDAEGKPRINLEVRLGGIYALERIARDSPRDQGTIMEVLSAYVRDNAPAPPANAPTSAAPQKLRADIQAILTVIGRRDISNDPEGFGIDLSNAKLSFANLSGANLSGANLSWTDRGGKVDLSRANLRGADLSGATLEDADLEGAHLEDAGLEDADLSGATLTMADLDRANLDGADLDRAHLYGAYLGGGNLDRAHLDGANLSMANLSRAALDGADLSGADGLSQEQLDEACVYGENIILPPNLHRPPNCY
jgi:hypothetical protein